MGVHNLLNDTVNMF